MSPEQTTKLEKQVFVLATIFAEEDGSSWQTPVYISSDTKDIQLSTGYASVNPKILASHGLVDTARRLVVMRQEAKRLAEERFQQEFSRARHLLSKGVEHLERLGFSREDIKQLVDKI